MEAAENATIYKCLKCIWKVKSAQKVTAKVTEKSAGFGWTVLDEYAKEAVIFYIRQLLQLSNVVFRQLLLSRQLSNYDA